MTRWRLAAGAVPALLVLAHAVHAVPPSREEIAQWCADAEGTAECNRLIEERQLKRLPGLAARSGAVLNVTLFPSGTAAFTDVDDVHGGTSYSLWDDLSAINAAVVAVTREDRTTYTLLMRAGGRKVEMPAEPVLSPDRQHIVTADFCAQDCSNEVALWQVARDGVTRVSTWKPAPTWSDVAVKWIDADTLVFDCTPMGETQAKTLQRKISDPIWQRAAAR